ncbi:hypothetical protein J4729_07380 [Leisingera sp. HS039]|uniref:hypothetical protein n=1 Tax=Leisingera sp. HS039 TaxID=2818496 RepID=UPI001B3A715D|nr:hypothetical protein [Leisingera sp. HS039]MBQ4824370.1 hypothetical protein [Leisingera sp. HS039]
MAWYRTGTVSIAQGSAVVTGAGTNWISQHAGWVLVTIAGGTLHEIKEVISSTELRLAKPVIGAGAAGLEYFIIPTHSLNADLIAKINEMISQFTTSREAWQAVYSDFSASTYQLWKDQGNSGTIADFLAVLKGDQGGKGDQGDSVYDDWLAQGNAGSFEDFLAVLAGQASAQAEAARDDALAAQSGAETAEIGAVAVQGEVQVLADQVTADLAAVAHIYDTFDDRNLGAKDEDPVTDNDGDPLILSARYWNTVAGEERVWNGEKWIAPLAAASTAAQQAQDAAAGALASETAAVAARGASQASAAAAAASEANTADSETVVVAAKAEAIAARDQVQIQATGLDTAVSSALAAQAGSETARDAAQASAAGAAESETNAAASSGTATAKAAEAAIARDETYTARDTSLAAVDKAGLWAGAPENTEVEPGAYSAAHHAAKSKAHADAASIASNAQEWVPGMSVTRGKLYWSPVSILTYRAAYDRAVSSVDPTEDTETFVRDGGGGGGGAQFGSFEVNGSGELILSFYDPGNDVSAGDFSIDADGNLLVEI